MVPIFLLSSNENTLVSACKFLSEQQSTFIVYYPHQSDDIMDYVNRGIDELSSKDIEYFIFAGYDIINHMSNLMMIDNSLFLCIIDDLSKSWDMYYSKFDEFSRNWPTISKSLFKTSLYSVVGQIEILDFIGIPKEYRNIISHDNYISAVTKVDIDAIDVGEYPRNKG